MTQIPVDQSPRMAAFAENELNLMRGALASFASDILADAEREEIDAGSLPDAGATFAQCMVLAYEIGDQLGEEHPPADHAVVLGQCVADGDAPLAARMAREAEGND